MNLNNVGFFILLKLDFCTFADSIKIIQCLKKINSIFWPI